MLFFVELFEGMFDTCFVAARQNPTNVAAWEWFLSAVWPKLRALLPEAALTVAGAAPPGGWARGPGVKAVGFMKNLAPLLAAARVFVSPVKPFIPPQGQRVGGGVCVCGGGSAVDCIVVKNSAVALYSNPIKAVILLRNPSSNLLIEH